MAHQKPYTATEAMSRLDKKANKLVILECLTKNEKARAADALAISKAPQSAWKRQKYKLFLCDLLENGGPHLFLLCAIALGQVIVANMKECERRRLIGLAKNNTQLARPIIRDLAIQCQIRVSLENVTETSQHAIGHLQSQTCDEATQAPSQPLDKMSTGRQIELMWSKAPVDLIPQLGDLMTKAIESSHQWKVEREAGDKTTDCFVTIVPEDRNADISINMRVGQRLGLQLLTSLKLRPMWSSLLGHLSP